MFDNVKAGKQIALLRKSKDLTQEDVARELNISPQAVSKWENGCWEPAVSCGCAADVYPAGCMRNWRRPCGLAYRSGTSPGGRWRNSCGSRQKRKWVEAHDGNRQPV